MKDLAPNRRLAYQAKRHNDHLFLIGLTFVAGAMAGAIVALIGVM
jgi:hypothetical protein